MRFIKKILNHSYFKKNAPSAFAKTYQDIERSKVYKIFCQKLHGTDFSCLNTLSKNQSEHFYKFVTELAPRNFLDLGSGNGRFTKDLSHLLSCKGHGIDFALKPNDDGKVTFSKEDAESFKHKTKYQLIVSIDSFYMIRNYHRYLKNLKNHLTEQGTMIFCFTLVDEEFKNSAIPKALEKLSLNYDLIDFTTDDSAFWQKSRDLLNTMNEEFVSEDMFKLWNIKKKEADKNISLQQRKSTKRYTLIAKNF